jgi:hypothetical protein
MARWPLHPAPLDDETLSSWLSRLAAAYEMAPRVFWQATLALTPQSLHEGRCLPTSGPDHDAGGSHGMVDRTCGSNDPPSLRGYHV